MYYRNNKSKCSNSQVGNEVVKYQDPKTYFAVGVIGLVLILNFIRWLYPGI